MKMYANVNAPPTFGANAAPQPNVSPEFFPSAPSFPTYTAPAYTAPAYGYCAPACPRNDFVLIVVLFILLIIVGAFICF
ncbi:sporulation protein YjcZ [Niallia circulans]|jgi:uncharacterized protein (TIGR01732 family)|nr:sporulation protein YjcZ [Niallia circulans]PAD89762.1 sporulation protein YjcZ [Niallia circulans]PAE14050.1 sporulation protein YjcZ [Niallia circulans]